MTLSGDAKRKSDRRRTPEENVAAGFPLAEEFGAFILPDGRVCSAVTGEWMWPVECRGSSEDGREAQELPH